MLRPWCIQDNIHQRSLPWVLGGWREQRQVPLLHFLRCAASTEAARAQACGSLPAFAHERCALIPRPTSTVAVPVQRKQIKEYGRCNGQVNLKWFSILVLKMRFDSAPNNHCGCSCTATTFYAIFSRCNSQIILKWLCFSYEKFAFIPPPISTVAFPVRPHHFIKNQSMYWPDHPDMIHFPYMSSAFRFCPVQVLWPLQYGNNSVLLQRGM